MFDNEIIIYVLRVSIYPPWLIKKETMILILYIIRSTMVIS